MSLFFILHGWILSGQTRIYQWLQFDLVAVGSFPDPRTVWSTTVFFFVRVQLYFHGQLQSVCIVEVRSEGFGIRRIGLSPASVISCFLTFSTPQHSICSVGTGTSASHRGRKGWVTGPETQHCVWYIGEHLSKW